MASSLALNIFGRLCAFIVCQAARRRREQITSAAAVIVVEVQHRMWRAGAHVVWSISEGKIISGRHEMSFHETSRLGRLFSHFFFHPRNVSKVKSFFEWEKHTNIRFLLAFSPSHPSNSTHLSVLRIPPMPCVRQFIELCDWECERFLLLRLLSSSLREFRSWSLDDEGCFEEYLPPPSLRKIMRREICTFSVEPRFMLTIHSVFCNYFRLFITFFAVTTCPSVSFQTETRVNPLH